MALNAYLHLSGQKSGAIQGSVSKKGQEGAILVFAVSHQIVSPRDAASGLASGKRQHHALVITKELDRSTPLLFNVLCTNENISSFRLRFYAPTTGGVEKQNFTIELTNANIASIDFRMPNNKHADLAKLPEYEEVAFTYQQITWTWTEGGIMAMDSWGE